MLLAIDAVAIEAHFVADRPAADLSVVYIAVPALKVSTMTQRYTCLESRADGGLYRYESLVSGFTRDLPVDAKGLVIDYPGLWKSYN